MAIDRVETFLVAPRWLFVRIETSDGVVGWGEATCEGRSATVATAVSELSELLVGADPARIEDHHRRLSQGWTGWANPVWRYSDGGFAEW